MALLDGNTVAIPANLIKTLKRGATWDPIIVLKDSGGTPINISAFYQLPVTTKGARIHLRQAFGDLTPKATPTATILSSGTTGQIQLFLDPATTTLIPSISTNQLEGDLELYDNSVSPNVVRTPVHITVTLEPEWTY